MQFDRCKRTGNAVNDLTRNAGKRIADMIGTMMDACENGGERESQPSETVFWGTKDRFTQGGGAGEETMDQKGVNVISSF